MQEMSTPDIEQFLGRAGHAVLALSAGGDAYAIPVLYGRDENAFYFHMRPGMKDDYLAATKQACLLVSEVASADSWRSVHVLGRIERLTGAAARAATDGALRRVPFPPDWALGPEETARRTGKGSLVWRLMPGTITGRESRPGVIQAAGAKSVPVRSQL
ncbi:MAG TPA: pyridoxamine 5'-phosphate oxidase family protein [Candidatus Thermoplasmatota archaeon]